MESIVFFGKGGIGKSTVAANYSILLAAKGRKVLHVGCDPKMDSTLSLMGRRIRPFNDQDGSDGESSLRKAIHRAMKGIDCIEAGGPQAGVGCAGAVIGSMLDAMKESSLIEKEGYDAVVFDVLGDVVCGGFAAPLRRAFASKAVLVVSEELLSLYAANNLISMVGNYSRNGVYLAGLAVNAKDLAGVGMAHQFARAANTRVLGVIPRDPAVARAEKARKPVVALEPRSEASKSLARLAAEISAAGKPEEQPRMLGAEEFDALVGGLAGRVTGENWKVPGRGKKQAAPDVLLEKAGFSVTGLSGGQVVCSWKGLNEAFRIFVASVSEAREGMTGVSDWAFCFVPGWAPGPADSRAEFNRAIGAVSNLRFDDFIAAFSGNFNFYENAASFGKLSSHPLMPEGERPREPQVGFGQWQRFIFSDSSGICVPPGAVMVEHGDSECRFSSCSQTPLSTFQKMAGLSRDSLPSLGPLLPKEDDFILNTDFSYADVVKGDEKKIAATLASAAARSGEGGLVEFYAGCSPLVMASDINDFTSEAARKLGVEVLRDNFNGFCTETPEKVRARSAFVGRRLAALGRVKISADLNLIGFRTCHDALSSLLVSRGMSLTTWKGEFYKNILSARLQVLAAPDPVMTKAFDKLGIKWAAPVAPYGFAATRAWLLALSKALGGKNRGSGLGPTPREAQRSEALSRNLSRFAAGFIVLPEELGMIEGSWAVSGVPLVSFLSQAGLKLRIFVYAPTSADRARGAAEAKGLAARTGSSVKLVYFDSPASLTKALSGDRALRLVYSDIPMDPRLAAAGKNSFSVALCEPGYDGATETMRRLARLCEWDFNERYFT